jgi:hypothetical protein
MERLTDSAELTRVLRAAYGPAGEPRGAPFEPEKAVALAAALGLDLRLAARMEGEELAALLGEPAAARLQALRRREAARALALLDLPGQVAEAASTAGAKVVLLKGAALIAYGAVEPGSRWLGDVDVLVARDAHQAVMRALLRRGFEEHPDPPGRYHHHAPPLYHPDWGTVELHSRIPGLGAGGPGDATAEELFAAELCLPAADEECWLPRPEVMAAHAVTHARVQNRNIPGTSLFSCLSDLLDLAALEGGIESLLAAAAPFASRALREEELAALSALAATLEAGHGVVEGSPEGRLLAGGLVAALDPGSRGRLWRQRLAQRVRSGQWRRLWRAAGRRLLGARG